jgi:hypothetical protein
MMKNVLRVGLLFLGVLFAFGATGNAQISRQYTVHIPFDFTVGAKTMKSGDYLIAPLSGISDLRAIVLRDRSGSDARVIGQATISSSTLNKEGRLVFEQRSGQWLLSDVVTSGFTLRLAPKASETAQVTLRRKPEARVVTIDR